MKAMVLTGRGVLELQDIPVPDLHREGVMVEVEAAAICNSTDLRILDAEDPTAVWPNQPWPFVMGHEVCGRIVDVGADVSGWSRGDRIAGWCPPFGGFAEYCQMYPGYMAAVNPPEDLPAEEAALLELCIGTARYFMPDSVRRVVETAKSAVVTGLGPSGLLYVRECVLLGIENVYASDRHRERRDLALKFGAREVFCPSDDPLKMLAERGLQADVGVDTTGADVAEDLLAVIRPGGALIPFGVGWDWSGCADKLAARNIALSSASLEEARLAVPMVMDWIASGKLALSDLITRSVRLEDLPEALERIRRREDIKVVVLIKQV